MQAKLAESKAALPEQETFGATKKFKLTSAMNSEVSVPCMNPSRPHAKL